MEPTIEWFVHFIILSLIAAIFIWIGVKVCSGARGRDYFTAIFVGAAAILAIDFVQYFLGGNIGIIGGTLISAAIALLILTIFIVLAYDIGFVKSLCAAIIAVIAILITLFVLSYLGFGTGLLGETAQSL